MVWHVSWRDDISQAIVTKHQSNMLLMNSSINSLKLKVAPVIAKVAAIPVHFPFSANVRLRDAIRVRK